MGPPDHDQQIVGEARPLPGLAIRPVRVEDAVDLRDHLFAHRPTLDIVSSVQASLERAATGQELRLVATLRGRVVGQVQLVFHPHPSEHAHRASLEQLVVGRSWQGRGIGRALVEGAAAAAVRRQVRLLTVSVRGGTTAEAFFRACRFNEYGRLRGGLNDPWSGQFNDEVLLCRRVAG